MIEKIKVLVIETAKILTERQATLATAESCTGGGLSYWLTSVPGSSNWFERCHVTYSNAAKIDLGVSASTLEKYGAVSEETARAMAEGMLRLAQSDWSIAITGIAGPGGGHADKPVGTVWIAWSSNKAHVVRTLAQRHLFSGDRQAIRLAAIACALEQFLAWMRENSSLL
jgi:nicotinamide-nucleotide amidase